MARVTGLNPFYLSNNFNNLQGCKSPFGPQFGLVLVHTSVDRLSSTLVYRDELLISMKVCYLESQ